MEGSGSSSRSRSDDRVREWEEGLPSVSEITPLSQCLISPQLASAFSITSDIPPYHTVADVNRASESIVSILRGTSIPAIDTAMASIQKPMQEDKHAQGNPSDNRHSALNSNDDKYGHGDGKPNESSRVKTNYQLSSRNKPAYVMAGPAGQSNADNLNSNDEEAAYMRDQAGMGMAGDAGAGNGSSPVPSYSSDAPARMEADQEPEEVSSPPAANENPNDDSNSRSLKRPRLVWTPELHKRFIEAVDHLGINNAVPKNIMQLMNVDGLTRENVASHLQKYRLYLKRVKQGEGPTSSDHLFVSNNPVASGYAPSAGYYQGVPPAHMEDVMAMPFPPPHASHLMGRAPIGGPPNTGVPVAPMDPFSYNVFTRPPPPGFMHADPKQMHMAGQNQVPPFSHHILRLFPTGK